MWTHPFIQAPAKIILWLVAAVILLPLSFILMVIGVLFVLGGLKIVGL